MRKKTGPNKHDAELTRTFGAHLERVGMDVIWRRNGGFLANPWMKSDTHQTPTPKEHHLSITKAHGEQLENLGLDVRWKRNGGFTVYPRKKIITPAG